MANKGVYVRNRQGLYLTKGRPERRHERVRWVRTKEEAGPCATWMDADNLRVGLRTMNPRGQEPDIVDNFDVVLTPERAKRELRFSETHTQMVQREAAEVEAAGKVANHLFRAG